MEGLAAPFSEQQELEFLRLSLARSMTELDVAQLIVARAIVAATQEGRPVDQLKAMQVDIKAMADLVREKVRGCMTKIAEAEAGSLG